jgi:hypothetical protein
MALTIMPSSDKDQPGEVQFGRPVYVQLVANSGETGAEHGAGLIGQGPIKVEAGREEAENGKPSGGFAIGSAVYERSNERRYELIQKRVRSGLNAVEEAEFQQLQTEILGLTKAAFPHPRIDREALLRAKEGAREMPDSPE